MLLLNTAYFPPIEYFAQLAKYSFFYLEACENYRKQSYRNRCYFYGASGKEMLQVSISHIGEGKPVPIRKVPVDYSTPWVIRTQRAIDSAYRTSAYFEYYRDSLFSILDSKPEFLWDLNLNLIRYFIEKCGLRTEIRFTEELIREYPDGTQDLRDIIHPKKESSFGKEKPYFQVFSGKYGFIPNLSIMDLLFNEGPDSISYLRTSSRL